MTSQTATKTVTFDAKGKSMGRLATSVVRVLIGKDTPAYTRRNPLTDVQIKVSNISQVHWTGKKLSQKVYYHHTGYIGHLKEQTAKERFAKDPQSLFRSVVRGMLPKNNQRDRLLKKIVFVS